MGLTFHRDSVNTSIAIVDLSRFNNSCLKSPASSFSRSNFAIALFQL